MKYIQFVLKHPLFTGSFMMVGGNMVANVVNYIYQIYFAGRFLGPVGNGELGSLFAILYIVTIVPMSTSASVVKFISTAKDKEEAASMYVQIKKVIWKMAFVIGGIFLVASPLVANFLHVSISGVVIIPFILFLSVITLVNQSSMQGILKFWGSVGPNILSSVAKLILGFILVALGMYVFGAMIGVLIAVLLAYFYSEYLLKKHIKTSKTVGSFQMRKFFEYSLPVLAHSLSFTAFFTVDTLLVKHFFPVEMAGKYIALSTLGKIIYFAASPIAAVMFPMIAGRHSKGERYYKLLLTSLVVTFLISISAVAVYTLLPNLVVSLSYGSKYLDIVGYLPWMGLFICFYTLSYLMVNFFLSVDKTRIVILPFIFAIAQIILITIYHTSLLQVVQISFGLMVSLFTVLSLYLVYNRLNYAKR